MDGNPWTKVRGRKSRDESPTDGNPTVDGSPTDESPTYVGRAKFSRRCGDGGQRRSSSQRNTTMMAGQRGAAAMQARAAAAHVAAASQRCCNTRHANATTLFLQLSSHQRCDVVAAAPVAKAQRRCCSKRRSNATTARVTAALLQQVLQQRCGAALARVVAALKQASWQRCSVVASSQQRRRATRWRGGWCSRQRQAALRCSVAMSGGQNFILFYFILLDSFKRARKRKEA